ncbi:hypothetical protein PHLCEN_2v1244 [Hermanssonia centrifuga]|uniref:Uncharacterized protein n=1 Tax=Hermanssonia centrifuga TaxID=98765 RepID=A0A2R6S3S2_9APHY|nr:hypothetical protein PHLCEN_2v1244 [Hermanssonia centrifuga]
MAILYFIRVCTVAVLLGTSSVLANPVASLVRPSSHVETRRAPSSPGSLPLNPTGSIPHGLESAMSNGQRLARGLSPKKPKFRRAEVDRSRPRPSPTPTSSAGPKPTKGACVSRTGIVHVTSPSNSPDDGRGARPHLDGYLGMRGNVFGEFEYTTERRDALTVTVDDCAGAPFDLVASNGFKAFPFVGGIKGFSSDSPNLAKRSYNYVYIGGVTETGPHATPRNTGNAFSAATDISEVDESAIWSFQKGSNTILEAQWVNADGCEYPG